ADRILVACGERASRATGDIIIVDPESDKELPDGMLGTIALSGPCISQGYWRRESTNDAIFRCTIAGRRSRHYFRRADRGFFHGNLLFVLGRGDDLIILNGVNYYPQDIEEVAAAADPRLPKWRTAAFATGLGTNTKLVVMQEAPRRGDAVRDELHLVRSIQKAVFDNVGVGGVEVLIIEHGRLRVTSTGKIRRSEGRALYEAGETGSLLWQGRRRTNGAGRTNGAVGQPNALGSKTNAVLDRWRQLLAQVIGCPTAEIDLTVPISTYPLDSLKLAQLYTMLEAQFGITFSLNDLYGARDIESLIHADPHAKPLAAAEIIRDTRRADAVRPSVVEISSEDFVVTGATGMLGAQVVKELLRCSGGKVYCLVRKPEQRLSNALQQV